MDWTSFALVGGICILIGFLGASLLYGVRRKNEDSATEDASQEGLKPLVKLWRRTSDGSLVPELNRKMFDTAEDLGATQHANLSEALVDFYKWMTGARFEAPSLSSSDQPAASPPTRTPQPEEPPQSGWISPASSSMPSSEDIRPSLNPLKPFLEVTRRNTVPRIQETEKSIATQIDEILQGKLANSPLSERGIRLIEWPTSGMRILVGQDQYDEVDAIPDEEIRNLIREATTEWQARKLQTGSV